jgi:hypothetical protein
VWWFNRKMDTHVQVHFDYCSDPNLIERLNAMSAALDRLTAEVGETATAVDSVLALVTGLADQIRALKEDPVKLAALADELEAKQAAIAAAVAANTPEPPTP